jgi:two-component system, NtrC family, sensor histidine kinase KinB
MKVRHLQTRFILAGGLLVMTTVVSGLWSAWTFNRLGAIAGQTLQASKQTADLTAVLSNALEREDDAYLLAMNGDRAQAKQLLKSETARFGAAEAALVETLTGRDEESAADALREHVAEYREAGNALFAASGSEMPALYQRRVNPALRRAVSDCTTIRELSFRSMRLAALSARDEAHRATIMVTAISSIALLISTLVAVLLARSVLLPVRELSKSAEALRSGDFDRRVNAIARDELGELALEFNRMADALAEFRRSKLGEVIRAKETLETTIAALPDAVVVIDPDGRIVAHNPAASAVLAAFAGNTAKSVKDLSLPAASMAAITAALRGEPSVEARTAFARAFSVTLNGHRCRLVLTAVPIPNFRGEQYGAVVIFYDVSEFARLDELRMELVGVASHELKTPLTTLRMNLLLLGEEVGNLTARQQEILATALEGCQELANTIDELLDLTRIEAGQLRLSREVVDLHPVISRAVAAMRQRFDDAIVGVQFVPQSAPAIVRGDPVRLGMVVTNLLSNALKYTPHGGRVWVSVSSGQNAGADGLPLLQIAVTDTGSGIPAQLRERVFDKFFRVEQHHQNGQAGVKGAGIGLYLCRQIIEGHGGSISCQPGENGLGTRFELVLPAYVTASEPN